MMSTVRVNKHFQVTIPATIRRRLQINAGDSVEVTLTSEGVLYKPEKGVNLDKETIAYWKERINNEEGEWVEVTEAARKRIEATLAEPSIGPFSSVEEMLADMNERRRENIEHGVEL